MEDRPEIQDDFDLDAIMSEFHGDSPESDVDLDQILGELGEDESLTGEEPKAEAVAEAAAETPEVPVEETADTLVAEIDRAIGEEIPDGDTIRMETLSAGKNKDATVPGDADTRNLETLQELDKDAPEEKPAEPIAPPKRIVYDPRARLRELKRKLVAGPEKRYYELSEQGVLRLQIAIGLNIALSVLCILLAAMFAMGWIPEDRLKLVIFSQILFMLISALLGANSMIDGIADLFRGRLTIHFLTPITLLVCCADAVFCLSELRVPCCAAFSLQITMALLSRYHQRTTEMSQMDTLRKAVRLIALVKVPEFYEKKSGFLRTEGEVEDFMDTYDRPSGPEKVQGIYALISLLICSGIASFAAMNHGISMALQVFSTGLLVAVPAGFFVSLTRPMMLLERRLHMTGAVLCGWKGVKGFRGKAVFPLRDEDIFPGGSTKLNGVKFYGERPPEDVISYAASLICSTDSGLEPLFRQMLNARKATEYPVVNFRDYGSGGIGAEIQGEAVLMGSLDFLQEMGVTIPQGTMVSQAVYTAIDGELCGVFAISYAKMRPAAAGLVSLCGNHKIIPVLTGADFMLTDSLIREKFKVKTRRIQFPEYSVRRELNARRPDGETPALALATRDELDAYAYAASGAQALRSASIWGVVIHLIAGIVGIAAVAALAYLGETELMTPIHVLLYQLVWMIPGILITEWTRIV